MLISCGGGAAPNGSELSARSASSLETYGLAGDVQYVHDPAIIRQESKWYVFSTDVNSSGGHLPIRCSSDKSTWRFCGYVLPAIPSWILARFPDQRDLWAPEVKFFGGRYRLYYCASKPGTNESIIGEVSNATLDSSDPAYEWRDDGMVLETRTGDTYNALDPSVTIDSDGSAWLTYGSYFGGIKQQRLDSATGKISSSDRKQYSLAARRSPHAIEASSLVHHGVYYYLFVSFDGCCNGSKSTYRIMVGRSTSIHGPFRDSAGRDMMMGAAEQVLAGNSQWAGPGGQTVLIDPEAGDGIVYHAYATSDGSPWLHVNSLNWMNDWPVIGP